MEQRTVTHEGQGKTYEVTVSEATALAGMRHTLMISEALTFIRERRPEADRDKPVGFTALGDDEMALFMLRQYAWPDCMAVAIESNGFNHQTLTFEEFAQLPEVFVAKWQKAARELNPHWYTEEEKPDQAEKKDESISAET